MYEWKSPHTREVFDDHWAIPARKFYERLALLGVNLTGETRPFFDDLFLEEFDGGDMVPALWWDHFMMFFGPLKGCAERLALLMKCRFFHWAIGPWTARHQVWHDLIEKGRVGTFVMYPRRNAPYMFKLHYIARDGVAKIYPFDVTDDPLSSEPRIRVLKTPGHAEDGKLFANAAEFLAWRHLSEDANDASLARPPPEPMDRDIPPTESSSST
jgi:hypothetical protein